MNGWSYYWLAWFFTMATAFLVPECVALARGNGNTLSENIWRFEEFIPGQSIFDWSFAHFAFIGVLLLFMVWLLLHFAFGIWR